MRHALGTALATLALGGPACQPSTTRPTFAPVPEAAAVEIRLGVPAATERLAAALRADSIPITRIEARDGYIETPWFDPVTGRPTTRRPLGPDVVRVRGWVDPTRARHSVLTVETVLRSIDDPSLPARELETAAPEGHPAVERVLGVLQELGERLGDQQLAGGARPGLGPVPPTEDEEPPGPPAGDGPPSDAPPVKPAPKPEVKAAPVGPAAPALTPAKPTPGKPTPAKPPPTPARPTPSKLAPTKPDTARPAATRPEAAKPEAAKPEAAKPEAAKPAPRKPGPTLPQPPATAPRTDRYSVQIAAVKSRSEAAKAIASVRPLGMTAGIVEESGLLKVRVGGFTTQRAARAAANRINVRLRIGAFVVPPRR